MKLKKKKKSGKGQNFGIFKKCREQIFKLTFFSYPIECFLFSSCFALYSSVIRAFCMLNLNELADVRRSISLVVQTGSHGTLGLTYRVQWHSVRPLPGHQAMSLCLVSRD